MPVSFPRLPGIRPLLAASLTLLASGGLFAQSTDQNSGQSNQNDVSALKTQMQKMQKEYEDRISAMEAEMKSLESKADSGSILNTRVLSDADGKEVSGAPTLDESFLKSLTRNFTFSAYVRAGFQFNGNGGGGNFNFSLPFFPGEGRLRLGNENDTYMELTWMQAHMLGDSPDVMDVSMTFTPAIRYVQNRNTFTQAPQNGVELSGNDFGFILRQAFLEASNVFKNAPEVTFWAGERFYDRWNTDAEDYFWLDTSGYGVGVHDIDVGIGKLWLAWIAGLDDNRASPGIGSMFKHTFDVRLKNINIGPGQLTLVLLGNYEKGGTFTTTYDNFGNPINLTNPLHYDSGWGIGGGAIYQIHYGPGGSNNSATFYALFGRGATDFLSSTSGADTGFINQAESTFLFYHPGFKGTINVGDVINHAFNYRAGFQAYVALPWYHSAPAPVAGTSKDGKGVVAPGPAPAPALPWFSVGIFGDWQEYYGGSAVGGQVGPGIAQVGGNVVNANQPFINKVASGRVHDVQFGARPAVWLADNIAIQGQFGAQWESNNNQSGYPGFGKSGWLGVFDVGPVIKPKGGYYTRPEIRFYATYAVWSDSLRGTTTPVQEFGTPFMPPYNGNTNHGWLFGTQVEWFF
jgi:maltoporin